MSLPKWLEEKLASRPCRPDYDLGYKHGTERCAEILLPEMKLLVSALEQIAQEGKWAVDRAETELRSPEQVLARRTLARYRETFELDEPSETISTNERSQK